jgi:hypothetical protein
MRGWRLEVTTPWRTRFWLRNLSSSTTPGNGCGWGKYLRKS